MNYLIKFTSTSSCISIIDSSSRISVIMEKFEVAKPNLMLAN